MRSTSLRSIAAFTCLAAVGCGGSVAPVAQSTMPVADEAPSASASFFQIGGSESNFGETSLSGGFLPDPFTVDVVSGSTSEDEVDVSSQGLTTNNNGSCAGYATREPDFILHFDNPGEVLRFFVTAGADTTLIINDGQGNWWCSDDDGGNLNPMIDVQNPPAGQYDIWVGSYAQDANIHGVLSITELTSSVHP